MSDQTEEQQIEEMIRAKCKTAARVTPSDIDEAIDPYVKPQYHRFPGTTVTVCCLTLRNGFTVVGESAAVSMENFDEEIGQEVAYKDARNKIWPLAGFALRERLISEQNILNNPSD